MKIFFLGGTFDPPHLGHLGVSQLCLQHCDKLVIIPSKQNPFKSRPFFSCSERVEMLDIMFGEINNIEIDLFEVKSDSSVNYSIDTIKYLADKYVNHSIYMVLGQDVLRDIHNWRQWSEIKEIVNIACISRPGYADCFNSEIKEENIFFINSLNLDISSSDIRQKIISDDPIVQDMLHKDVFKYLSDSKICQ